MALHDSKPIGVDEALEKRLGKEPYMVREQFVGPMSRVHDVDEFSRKKNKSIEEVQRVGHAQKRRAIAYLSEVFATDPVFRELIATESDFDPIRCDPEFQAICAKVEQKDKGLGIGD